MTFEATFQRKELSVDILPSSKTVETYVSSQFFGGNLLFDRGRLGPDGTCDEKLNELHINFVRYPGGAIAEEYFDLMRPNRTLSDAGRKLLPLVDFIDYIASIGGTAALVLPSIRYMRALSDDSMSEGDVRAELRKFLRKLEADRYGDHTVITHIEIGNEYYAHRASDWNVTNEYAKFAPLAAEEIRSIFGDKLTVSVQSGIMQEENRIIAEAFEQEKDLVDAVIFHEYPFRLETIDGRQDFNQLLLDFWFDKGIAEQSFLSEWSISHQLRRQDGTVIPSGVIDDGMARAVAMLDLAVTYIEAGVDAAAVWAIQQNTRGDLAGNEGETFESHLEKLSEHDLTSAGEVFRLMAESLPGKKLVSVAPQIALNSGGQLMAYAFEGGGEFVLFVSAYNALVPNDGIDLKISLPISFDGFSHTELYTRGNPETPNSAPAILINDGDLTSDEINVRIDRSYEVNRFVFRTNNDGKLVGSSNDDILRGWDASNLILAHNGDDLVYGDSGDDIIFGGTGSDTLFGEAGSDTLVGGMAEDRILGSVGNDVLKGGAGNDTLIGHQNDDVLRGGGGRDRLSGKCGSDTLWGDGGDDNIKAGLGADTVKGGGGADVINGGGGADLLQGGGGNDTITGKGGDDTLKGNGGADVFQFRASDRNDTILDFRQGQDLIEIQNGANSFAGLSFEQDGRDVLIGFGAGQIRVVTDSVGAFDEDDFIF